MSESSSSALLHELRSAAVGLWRDQNVARLAMLRRYSEIANIGIGELQLRGLADLIGIDLRCSRRVANVMVEEIRRFTGRTELTGEIWEPIYPLVASGLDGGLFSFDHAKVIADAIEMLSPQVRAEHGAAIEARLVVHAAEYDPISLRTLAKRIIALFDEDGPEPKDEIQYRRRGLRFTVLPDGSSLVSGRLTATATAAWQIIFGSLARVRNLSLDEEDNPIDGPDQIGSDQRSEPQRLHDALAEAGELLLENGQLPDHAGLKAEMIVAIDLAELEARAGRVTTLHGGSLTVQQVLQLATELNVIPVIFDQELGLVGHGRGRRLASPIQRKVIFARDRGCTFPGCDKVAGQSQVHHMDEWLADLGETNPDNLTLSCGYHNNEAPRQGWKARLIKGIPHWIPPRWRDPDQQPRRNYIHHPQLVLRD